MKNFKLWFIVVGIAITLCSIWVLWETPFLPETKKSEEVKTNSLPPGQYREGEVANLIENSHCEYFIERRNIQNENFYDDVYKFNVADSVIKFSLQRRDRVCFNIVGSTTSRFLTDQLYSFYGVIPNHFFQDKNGLIHLLASGFYGHHYIFNCKEEELQDKRINYAFSKAKINYGNTYYIALEEKSQGYVYDRFLFAGIYLIQEGESKIIKNIYPLKNYGSVDSMWIDNDYLFLRHDTKHYKVEKNVDETRKNHFFSKMNMKTEQFEVVENRGGRK